MKKLIALFSSRRAIKLQEPSGSINDSFVKLLTFVALKDDSNNNNNNAVTDDDVAQDTSQHRFYYIISGLQADSLYTVTVRMSNVFGFSNWTQPFYFETAAGQ
jgi:hypothetical protein